MFCFVSKTYVVDEESGFVVVVVEVVVCCFGGDELAHPLLPHHLGFDARASSWGLFWTLASAWLKNEIKIIKKLNFLFTKRKVNKPLTLLCYHSIGSIRKKFKNVFQL